jgi:hypothetical protein
LRKQLEITVNQFDEAKRTILASSSTIDEMRFQTDAMSKENNILN